MQRRLRIGNGLCDMKSRSPSRCLQPSFRIEFQEKSIDCLHVRNRTLAFLTRCAK